MVNRQRLFQQTHLRLAFAYSGVMGLILVGLGIGVYRAIAHAHTVTVDRELQSVAGTLHDSLQWKLTTPGKLEPSVEALLPNLCRLQTPCRKALPPVNPYSLSAINRGSYYIRLWDSSQRLVAVAGNDIPTLPAQFNAQRWQMLQDGDRQTYHQISLPLHTRDRQDWGTLQVGRSLRDIEAYLTMVRWCLGLGIPIALLLAALAGGGLAGFAMRPVYRAYSQIQQFSADVAHELRTPIAAMLATVESALRAPPETAESDRDLLAILQRQNLRLSQLVADLLLLSRLEQQPQLEGTACCLQDIASDLVEELSALALKANLEVNLESEGEPLLWVRGNSEQLYRLVSNLLMNAIQYTPSGGAIAVKLYARKSRAYLCVCDTGIGIAPEIQGKIFDRFYRGEEDRSRWRGGAGLGLAIAQTIALHHRGFISIESELGKGSYFTLELPLCRNPPVSSC